MQLIANLARVVSCERVLPDTSELSAADYPISMLRACADLCWRRHEWGRAADVAMQVLAKRSEDFHALAIVVSSLGHMGNAEAAYPYAVRLIRARRPNWTATKMVCAVLGMFNFLIPSRRNRFYRILRSCQVEAEADRRSVAYAQQVIEGYEAANGTVAA